MQELMEHLKESADITLPALSPIPEEAGLVEAALAQAQLPFVGSSAEALALTADRKRSGLAYLHLCLCLLLEDLPAQSDSPGVMASAA